MTRLLQTSDPIFYESLQRSHSTPISSHRAKRFLFSQSLVCGEFWGKDMGWSLPGGSGFVAAGRCARGQPGHVLRFCGRNVRRCPGVLYTHKARSANRVCSKLFPLGLVLHRRRPMDNSSLRVRVLEFSTRTKTGCVPFTEQAHMPSRELERR